MVEDEINDLVRVCKLLKYKFRGVYAAHNFPVDLSHNSFIIVHVSTSQSIGTYLTLIGRSNGKYIFADPYEQKLASYKHLHNRLASSADNILTVYDLLRYQPIQKPNALLCGLFCIYIAHNLFGWKKIVKLSDVDLISFALHIML